MKIIVDSNIVFSGILNKESRIGELLIKSKDYFDFYSVDQLKFELQKHKEKIIKTTGFSEVEYEEVRELAISKIKFIRDELIPKSYLIEAEKILQEIDIDDTVFVALADHLQANLWTGDLELINGLQKQGYKNTITTKELYQIYLKKEFNKL
ncbi:MAG: PIN domain-containing protein [Salinivirgaceae bacterium]